MIRLNGQNIDFKSFPDRTFLINHKVDKDTDSFEIEWDYDNEMELVALIYFTKHLKDHGAEKVKLFMPYIPNARQDRANYEEDVFTLKYFAEIINSLGYESVTVLDPHSAVSEKLIERIVIQSPESIIRTVIDRITEEKGEVPFLFYPDEGASKRYSGMIELPCAYGIKKRDWKSGKIKGLDISCENELIKGRTILIIDDICSKGGTFYHSAKKLRDLGAGDIYLYVTHCEHSVFSGDLLNSGFVKKIFTTDSIFRVKNHKMFEVLPCRDNY